MQRKLVRLLHTALWPRWSGGEIELLSVTVIARSFRVQMRDRTFDLQGFKKFVHDLFAKDGVSYVGFVEVVPVTTETRGIGHSRFQWAHPHAHLMMWGPPEAISRVIRLAPRRAPQERADETDNPPVVAKRMTCSEADLARVACYMAKSDRYGKRIRDGEWMRLNERLPHAALVDLFRLLNPYTLPELMMTSGEGNPIRQELVFGPDRRRRLRKG